MLIETTDGILNTDHVITAQVAPRSEGHKSLIQFTDGSQRAVGIGLHALEAVCGVIVPAQPGFTVVQAYFPGTGESGIVYSEQPVIAFRIGHGGTHDGPMPITAAGEPRASHNTRWTIRQPNGACFGPDESSDDLAEFKAACERDALRSRSAA